MANRIYISDIGKYDQKTVDIWGWLYNMRSGGKLRFLMIRDGTGIIQGVLSKSDVDENIFEQAGTLTQESSIKVTGIVRADDRAPGGFELQITDLQPVQISEEYPITPKEHGTTFLMDHRHLWLRSRKQHAILRIRHEIIRSGREYFDNLGFVLVDTPIFTPAACEGTTTLFETEYFGSKAYLTQSGQLYSEASIMAFGKVYCFGPTFRAEKSKTRRHLTEFWMLEPEVAYNNLDDNMDLAEGMVEYIVKNVLEKRREDLETLERDISKLEKVEIPFPRITYNEAADILEKAGADFTRGDDFGGTDETIISEQFDKPILVHRYPAAIKAFYMKNDPDNSDLSLSVDMLAPEGYGEIIGGGQREDDLEVLENKIKAHELPMEAFKWYLDLRKYGSVPHSGYGLGIERTVAWICGLKHIRETIPFPRLMHRIYP